MYGTVDFVDFVVFWKFESGRHVWGGGACVGLPQSRAGLGGHEANMGELGCMGAAGMYGAP